MTAINKNYWKAFYDFERKVEDAVTKNTDVLDHHSGNCRIVASLLSWVSTGEQDSAGPMVHVCIYDDRFNAHEGAWEIILSDERSESKELSSDITDISQLDDDLAEAIASQIQLEFNKEKNLTLINPDDSSELSGE